MRGTVKVIAGIGGVVVATAIAIGGWQLGWWLKTSATDRAAVTNQYGPVAQLQNLISQIDQSDLQLVDANMSQSERAALTPQKSALVHLACGISVSITPPLPSAEAAFVASNC